MPDSVFPLETDCRTVQARLAAGDANLLLLDCRELDEFQTVQIAGAKHVPMREIPSRLAELESFRGHDIAVYCHHGGRSYRVAAWLREQGFSRAQSLAGGIDQWATEIDPSLPRYE